MRPGVSLRPLAAIAMNVVAEALKNRIFWLFGLFVLAGFLLTEFLANVVLTETHAFQSALFASVLRLGAALVLVVFVATSTLREIHEKGLDLILSLPIPRWVYLIGKLLGFACVAGFVGVVCTVGISLYAPFGAALLWGVGVTCELFILCAFGLLCLLTFSQVTATLSVVSLFYVAGRTIGAIGLMADGPFAQGASAGQTFLDGAVAALAFVLPDFASFAPSAWLVYGEGDLAALGIVLVQTFVYVVLLCMAAMFDFYRKEF